MKRKVLNVSSESEPYATKGGVKDVVPALSKNLSKQGHEVKNILPRYKSIDLKQLKKLHGELVIKLGNTEEKCDVYTAVLPGSPDNNPVQVYFINHEGYFGSRDSIYGPYPDNPHRFAFFCRAAFELCRKINWYPDILHAHDWPASLAPVYLKYVERIPGSTGNFEKTASILTIHNLGHGYQGVYNKDNYNHMGFSWDIYQEAGFDNGDNLNMMRAGIKCADKLNTVSPEYAKETQTLGYGCGLDDLLRTRTFTSDYIGILNGIDTDIWNPEKDKFSKHFSMKDMTGKAKAKEELQKELGLPVDSSVLIIGMISRLDYQKGIWQLFNHDNGAAWPICRDMVVQMIVLGSGESWCEDLLPKQSLKLPNFKAKIGYDNRLAHLIEAGSDFYLMPSKHEPCGLNQLYSLAYGTLPIVRRTGGLIDTVINYNEATGTGTGFMFNDLTPQAIYDTVGWAVSTWYDRPQHIETMRKNAMMQDFSWENSTKKYVEMYESAIKKVNC